MRTRNEIFENELDMIKRMKNLGIPLEMIEYTLSHEMPHFLEAKRLGYNARYRLEFDVEEDEVTLRAYQGHVEVMLNPPITPLIRTHIQMIANAPENPSRYDLEISKSVQRLKLDGKVKT